MFSLIHGFNNFKNIYVYKFQIVLQISIKKINNFKNYKNNTQIY